MIIFPLTDMFLKSVNLISNKNLPLPFSFEFALGTSFNFSYDTFLYPCLPFTPRPTYLFCQSDRICAITCTPLSGRAHCASYIRANADDMATSIVKPQSWTIPKLISGQNHKIQSPPPSTQFLATKQFVCCCGSFFPSTDNCYWLHRACTQSSF